MNRRQFKIPPLRQVREYERERAKERLNEFVNPNVSKQEDRPDPDTGLDFDTRQISEPASGPLTDRIRTLHPDLFEAGPVQETSHAALYTLDGELYCEIPCSEFAGIIIIGRGQNATVRIDDPYVHRVHAHLRWNPEDEAHIIAHGGGENSTYINREKVTTPVKLLNGAHIRLGKTELIYYID